MQISKVALTTYCKKVVDHQITVISIIQSARSGSYLVYSPRIRPIIRGTCFHPQQIWQQEILSHKSHRWKRKRDWKQRSWVSSSQRGGEEAWGVWPCNGTWEGARRLYVSRSTAPSSLLKCLSQIAARDIQVVGIWACGRQIWANNQDADSWVLLISRIVHSRKWVLCIGSQSGDLHAVDIRSQEESSFDDVQSLWNIARSWYTANLVMSVKYAFMYFSLFSISTSIHTVVSLELCLMSHKCKCICNIPVVNIYLEHITYRLLLLTQWKLYPSILDQRDSESNHVSHNPRQRPQKEQYQMRKK